MSQLLLWGLALAIAAYVIITYNRFVALRVRAEASWSDIDVQLKRRYNLVPNLVETVKGYAAHEKTTLEQVTLARQQAIAADTISGQGVAEGLLTDSIHHLFAVVEAYPDLNANQSFLELQRQLTGIEDEIQNARRYYNAVVRDYNTMVDSFPDLIVARLLHFALRDYFELDTPGERQAPTVGF